MIQLGAIDLLIEAGVEDAIERGLRLIEHELTTYANLDGRIPELQDIDMQRVVTASFYRSCCSNRHCATTYSPKTIGRQIAGF